MAGPSDPTAPNKVSGPAIATGMNDPSHRIEQEFTTVKRCGRKKKGATREDLNASGPSQGPQLNLTPASYASAAATVVNAQQGPTPLRTTHTLPPLTEVTVIRHGGHIDNQIELNIRARAADAIVQEVRLNMAKAVSRPIPLRAGRWSVNARSKGNFVYSFNGHIPFDIISLYEHILLSLFLGSG